MEKTELETKAIAKRVKMSPYKVRKVINQIRGRKYAEALIILGLMSYRACYPVLQTVLSAAANANHNLGIKKSNLYISEARVDEGQSLKRFRPRAQGRGYPIRKPSCNIIIKVKQK